MRVLFIYFLFFIFFKKSAGAALKADVNGYGKGGESY